MKTLISRISTLFGITLLAAAMAFPFASCQPEPVPDSDDDPDDPKLEIPALLQNTQWAYIINTDIENKFDRTDNPYETKEQWFFSFSKYSVTFNYSDRHAPAPVNLGFYSDTYIPTHIKYEPELDKITIFLHLSGSPYSSNSREITYQNGVLDQNIRRYDYRLNGHEEYNKKMIKLHTYNNFLYTSENNIIGIYYYNGNGGNITIPEYIDGKPVKLIWTFAFYEKSLTDVSIPNSVTHIDRGAFNKNQLTSIYIPNVIYIGTTAFNHNPLTSITIGSDPYLVGGFETILSFIQKYYSEGNKAGTYTRPDANSDIWTRIN
jgi:hypothetical protein